MRTFFKLATVFFLIFAIKSVFAADTFAATIEGWLDNRAGSTAVTVSFSVKNESGGSAGTISSQVVAAGARQYLTPQSITSGDFPFVTWFTACNLGSSSTGGTGGAYTFAEQNVHCTTPNSTITVTSTNCNNSNGQIYWNVTSGYGGANIAYFKVYKSLSGTPDSDGSPLTVNYVSGTNSYSLPNTSLPNALNSLANGTWTLRVKAFTNSPDNNSVFADGQFTCPGTFTPPSSPGANINCISPSPLAFRVEFSWNPAAPGISEYRVETNSTSASGPWPGVIFTPSPLTNTYMNVDAFAAGTQYWWRVQAFQMGTGEVNYSTTNTFTTPSSCPANVPASALDLTFCAWGGYNAVPNNMQFRWSRATPNSLIQEEKLEYSTNPAFPPDTNITTGMVLEGQNGADGIYQGTNVSFTATTHYYWRINTRMTNNVWYPSVAEESEGIYKCTYHLEDPADPTDLHGFSYCDEGVSKRFLYWNGGNYVYTVRYDGFSDYQFSADYSYTSNAYFIVSTQGNDYNPSLDGTGTHTWKILTSTSDIDSNTITIVDVTCGPVPNAPNNLLAEATPPVLPAYRVGCNSQYLPSIDLKFMDNSSSETGYTLEVSREPFTGPATTNPSNMWGVKSLPANPGSGGTVTFTWSAASPLGWANANPGVTPAGSERVPIEETRYYWRVKAMGAAGQSSYVYPDGTASSTLNYSGLPFWIPICKEGYDLKVSMVAGSSRKSATQEHTTAFVAGESVDVDFKVENIKSSQLTTNGTDLFFYYQNSGVPTCPSPPGTADFYPAPLDGAGNQRGYPITSSIPLGGSVTKTVTFIVGSTPGTFEGVAYVMPTCMVGGGLSEYNWVNNNSRFSGGPRFLYSVGVPKFFETQGGDVGAAGIISADVDRSCFGKYQSDYVIAGGSIGAKIKGKAIVTAAVATVTISSGAVTAVNVTSGGAGYSNGTTVLLYGGSGSGATAEATVSGGAISSVTVTNGGSGYSSFGGFPTVGFCYPGGGIRFTNYIKPLVPGGGVYNYFASRFRSKAIAGGLTACTISNNTYNGLYYCGGDAEVVDGGVTIGGKAVFFVDGNLRVRSNVTVTSGDNAAVFVVGGNITVNRLYTAGMVNRLDGIYVARKGFADTDVEFGGENHIFNSAANALTVNGSLYVDGEEGTKANLLRYYSDPVVNTLYPSDVFKFDPKYIILLNTLLASSSVGWQEASP